MEDKSYIPQDVMYIKMSHDRWSNQIHMHIPSCWISLVSFAGKFSHFIPQLLRLLLWRWIYQLYPTPFLQSKMQHLWHNVNNRLQPNLIVTTTQESACEKKIITMVHITDIYTHYVMIFTHTLPN